VGKPTKKLSIKKMVSTSILNKLMEELEDKDIDLEIIT
jgi:hypothetical protein